MADYRICIFWRLRFPAQSRTYRCTRCCRLRQQTEAPLLLIHRQIHSRLWPCSLVLASPSRGVLLTHSALVRGGFNSDLDLTSSDRIGLRLNFAAESWMEVFRMYWRQAAAWCRFPHRI